MADFSAVWDAQCRAWEGMAGTMPRPEPAAPTSTGMLALSADGAQGPPGSNLLRRGGGEPVGALGRGQPEPRRLPSRMVPRPGRNRGRAGRHGCLRRRAGYPALSHRDATGGRPLAAEPVAGRQRRSGSGIQLDEIAFPVLLASALHERRALDGIPVKDMVMRALSFIARNGPATDQDRWEEDAGINTFTLAVAIAALVEGSTFLDGEARAFALRLADLWNARLEEWTLRSGHADGARSRRGRILHPHRTARCADAGRRPIGARADQESRPRPRLAGQRADCHRLPAARALWPAAGGRSRASSTR